MAGSFLRQATASQSRATPPFVDSTDFQTAETGLTIANTDVKLIVNGGASANKNSGGGTHRANGVYGLTFDATDTATVGEMEVSIVVAGALPVFFKFWVLEEAVYDALFGASAAGYQVPIWAAANSTVSLSGTTVATVTTATTATNLTNAPTSGDLTATMKTSVQTAAAAALTAYDPPTNAEMEARTIVAASYLTVASTPNSGFFTNQPAVEVDEEAIADTVADALEGMLGNTQPRINRKPDPGFTTQVSRRSDGTYKCIRPIRLTAGTISNVYVFIDMSPLFGMLNVETVGTLSVSAGSITAGTDKGPRDTYAVLELDGTADDDCEVTVAVTMESGTAVDVVFDVEVLE
jgi:hypothetical protein